MAAGPNIAIGVTVIMLFVVAGLLVYQGSNMVVTFGRAMFETRQARAERLRQEGPEADSQA